MSALLAVGQTSNKRLPKDSRIKLQEAGRDGLLGIVGHHHADPEFRTLQPGHLDDAAAADEVFSVLMN